MNQPMGIRLLLGAAALAGMLSVSTASFATSANVAIVDSTSVINGGQFPTTTSGPTGAFTSFTFTLLPVANVTTANLAAYDTVLLNMASSGINCTNANLPATAETALVNFVTGGGKLIIYDSECATVDYHWLPVGFSTSNPGALGATGTLKIDADNALASSVPTDATYINAPLLASGTDAVGDMNVMTTRDPNWCLSMSGTNAVPATGPVHAFAHVGGGLIIWNGLDVDFLSSSTSPDSANAIGNLAKIWLQELQVTGSSLTGCKQVAPGSTAVPTMSDLNLLITALLLAGMAALLWRRKLGA